MIGKHSKRTNHSRPTGSEAARARTVSPDPESPETRTRTSATQKGTLPSDKRSSRFQKDTTFWSDELVAQLLEIRKIVVPDERELAPYGTWKQIHKIWRERKLPSTTETKLKSKWTQLNQKRKLDNLLNQKESVIPRSPASDEEMIRTGDLYKRLENMISDANNFNQSFDSRTSTRMKKTPSQSDLKVLNLLFSDLYPRIEPMFPDKLFAINTLLYTIVNKYKLLKEPNHENICDKKEQDLIAKIKNITKKLRPLYAAIYRIRKGMKHSARSLVHEIKQEYNTFDLKALKSKIAQLKQEKNRCKVILNEHKKKAKYFKTNELFMSNEKKFYSIIENCGKAKQNAPKEEEVTQFWSALWEVKKPCNLESRWIEEVTMKLNNRLSSNTNTEPQKTSKTKRKAINNDNRNSSFFNIDLSHIRKSIHKKKNWSAPGPDMICNYWWKYIDSTWPKLCEVFRQMLNDSIPVPEWFCAGVTHRIPKPGPPSETNIRPITCLNTVYKMFTSIVLQYLSDYVEKHKLMTDEQRGAKRGVWGTYENLLIDQIIAHDANKYRNKSYSSAWLDITKAYDSVPHVWLRKCLEIHRVPEEIRSIIDRLMQKWSTCIFYDFPKKTRSIQIQNGIFQGDSLCPVLFCLALNPISIMIQDWNSGYKIKKVNLTFTHSMFIDDIKIYSTTQEKLNDVINLVKQALLDIGLHINEKKSGALIRHKGNIVEGGTKLPDESSIPSVTKTNLYKYLGFMQSIGIDKEKNKEIVTNEFKNRVERLIESSLSGFHLVKAYNTYCIGYLRYFFFMKWNYYELHRMEQILKKSLKKKGLHFKNFPVALFHLPRNKSGRGFCSIFVEYLMYRIGLAFKFHTNPNLTKIMELLLEKDHDSFYGDALTYGKEFGLHFKFSKNHMVSVTDKETQEQLGVSSHKDLIDLLRNRIVRKWLTEAQNGGMHFKFWNAHKERLTWIRDWRFVSKQCENMLWMAMTTNLQTKSLKKWYQTHNGKEVQLDNIKCRLCGKVNETTEHVVSGCSELMQTDIIPRHNSVLYQLLRFVLNRYGFQNTGKPQTEYSNNKVLIHCNTRILTIREVSHNVPDLVIYLHEEKRIQIIDVAIPYEDNLERRTEDKIQKYGPLMIELQKLYPGYKGTIIPIVIGTFGSTLPSFQENVKKVLGEGCSHEAKKLIRAAISGTFLLLTRWELRVKSL
jgi:hypothetical protein